MTKTEETCKETPESLPSKEEKNLEANVSSISSVQVLEPDEAKPAAIVLDIDEDEDPQISAATPEAANDDSGAPPFVTATEAEQADTKTISETEPVARVAISEDKFEETMELDEERIALLKKHAGMRNRCLQRSRELVEIVREGLEEEIFEMPEVEVAEISSDEKFPEAVVSNMARIIEGR